jgi:hypothetical protein
MSAPSELDRQDVASVSLARRIFCRALGGPLGSHIIGTRSAAGSCDFRPGRKRTGASGRSALGDGRRRRWTRIHQPLSPGSIRCMSAASNRDQSGVRNMGDLAAPI